LPLVFPVLLVFPFALSFVFEFAFALSFVFEFAFALSFMFPFRFRLLVRFEFIVLLFCWVLVFVVWATTLPPTTYSVANNTNEPRAAVSRLVQLFIFTAYSFRIVKGAVRTRPTLGGVAQIDTTRILNKRVCPNFAVMWRFCCD
jgi:hypothetical protein